MSHPRTVVDAGGNDMRSGGYEQVKGFLGFTRRFPDEQ